jgi:hypothetical protein
LKDKGRSMKALGTTLLFGTGLACLACSSSKPESHGPVYGSDSGIDAIVPLDGSQLDVSMRPEASSDGASPESASDGAVEEASTDGAMNRDASPCTSTVAVFGGSGTAAFGATSTGGAWTVAQLTGSVGAVPAIVGYGGGLQAVFSLSATDAVQYTAYTSSWSAPAPIGASLTAATPALAAVGSTLYLVYLGTNTDYYYGTYSGGAWDSASSPVAVNTMQSIGDSPPSASGVSGDLVIVQSGTDGNLYDQTYTGSWQLASQIAGATAVTTIAPTVVAASGGAFDLFVVFVHGGDYTLYWTGRASGVWSTPAQISATAYTNEPVALAAAAGGAFVLLYQGTDSKPYYSLYSPSASPAWTAPAALVTAANPLLPSPPSVATGVCGADAVAAYVQPGGVQIVTLSSGTWSAPSQIAGTASMTYAVVATQP